MLFDRLFVKWRVRRVINISIVTDSMIYDVVCSMFRMNSPGIRENSNVRTIIPRLPQTANGNGPGTDAVNRAGT